MGAWGVGFLGALGQKAKERAEQIRQNQQHVKDAQADFYLKSLQAAAANGTLTQDDYSYGMGQVQKIYGNTPEMKQVWGQVNNIVNKLHGHIQDQTPDSQHQIFANPDSGQQSNAGMLANATASPDQLKELNGGAASPTPSSGTDLSVPSSATPVLTPPPMAPQNIAQLPKPPSGSAANGVLDAVASAPPPSTAMPALGSSPTSTPPTPQLSMAALPQAAPAPPSDGMTGLLHHAYLNPTQVGERQLAIQSPLMDKQHQQAMELAKMQAQIYLNRQIGRAAPSQAMTIDDAIRLQEETGQDFADNYGQTVDLGGLKRAVGGDKLIEPTNFGGGRIGWNAATPKLGTTAAGNQVYNRNPYSGALEGPSMGIKNPGSSGTHAVVAIDPATGAATTMNMPTSRTMAAPGANPAAFGSNPSSGDQDTVPTASSGAAAPKLKTRGALAAPPNSPSANHAASTAIPAEEGSNQVVPAHSPKSMPIPIAQWNQYRQQAIPIRNAATQLFGDPTQPDVRPLSDFAPLADNKDSQQKVGQVIRLMLDGLEKNEETHGGLMQSIENYGGIPQMIAGSQTAVMQDAVNKLSPEERQLVDTTMDNFGAVIGLRSMTKASAGQFSIKKLENEVPLVGINSFSSSQVYNKLSRLAEQVYNGTKGNVAFSPQESKYYSDQVSHLKKLADMTPSSPKTKNLTAPPVQSTGDPVQDLFNSAVNKK